MSKESDNAFGNTFEVLQEMNRAMVLAGFSPKTRKVYLGYGRRFAEWTELPLEKAGMEEVRRYLVYLVEARGISRSDSGRAKSSREKVRRHRNRLRLQGLRPTQSPIFPGPVSQV